MTQAGTLTRETLAARIALLEGDHVMLDNPFTRAELLNVYRFALSRLEGQEPIARCEKYLHDTRSGSICGLRKMLAASPESQPAALNVAQQNAVADVIHRGSASLAEVDNSIAEPERQHGTPQADELGARRDSRRDGNEFAPSEALKPDPHRQDIGFDAWLDTQRCAMTIQRPDYDNLLLYDENQMRDAWIAARAVEYLASKIRARAVVALSSQPVQLTESIAAWALERDRANRAEAQLAGQPAREKALVDLLRSARNEISNLCRKISEEEPHGREGIERRVVLLENIDRALCAPDEGGK